MTTTIPSCDSSTVELPEVLSDLLTECQWTVLDSRTGGGCFYLGRGAGVCPLSAAARRDMGIRRRASGHPYEEDVRTR